MKCIMVTDMPQKEINWKLNLVIVAIAQFLAMVGTGCCQPFIPLFIRENLGIVDEQLRGVYVSLYFMAGMIALTLAYPFWGRLADRFGRKRMLLRASYAATFTYPLMYFAPNIWVLLLIRLISCFLAGTVVPARTLLVTTSPKEKHGMILGTLLAVMECGHVAGYLVGGLLVHYFGYFTSFMACGSVYLTSALLVHIFTRENFVPMVKEKAEKLKLRELASPALLWLLGIAFIFSISRRMEDPFIPVLTEHIVGIKEAALYTGIISSAASVGGVLAGLSVGWFCEKFKPERLIYVLLFFCGTGAIFQACSRDILSLIISRFFVIFMAAGFTPVIQILLLKITKPEYQGSVFGWQASMSSLGGLVCSFFAAGLTYQFGVRSIFFSSAGILFLLFVLMFPALRMIRKEALPEQ